MEHYKEKYESLLRDIDIAIAGQKEGEMKTVLQNLKERHTESEDEKIRKALIHLINEQDGFLTAINGISVKDVIAWLEKQGEQPNKVSLWKHWKDGIAGNGEGKLTYLIKIGNTYNLTSCLGFECDYIELSELDSLTLEKQGEQKSDDKLEPKLKTGDWIISSEGTLRNIVEVGRTGYATDKGWLPQEDYEKNFHLWTIQDAKEGDVLYHKSPSGIEYIVMSSGVNRFGNIDSYFRYNSVDGFGISVPSVFNTKEDITPATKEQRDLLFQEMKVAGYEWDDEKKELRKIEQQPGDKAEPKFKVGDWITDGKITFQIVKIEDDCYVADDGDKVWFSVINQYYHLWTIQDAKDGDVLYDGNFACIFRKLLKDDDGNLWIDSHCGVDVSNKFVVNNIGDCWCPACDCYPATKEQRDLLFSKTEEAGYEWDAEKKELKKINLNEAEHGKYYYCIKDYFSGGKKFSSKGDVVQALRGLPIMGLEDISEYFIPVNNVHNPAWSEDDERKINGIVMVLKSWDSYHVCSVGLPSLIPQYISWLDSLKERYTWKPSEGQLECLGYAIEKAEKDWSPLTNNRIYLTLKALKEQLEKL